VNELRDVNVIVPLEFFFQVPLPESTTLSEQLLESAGSTKQIVVVKVELTVGESVTGFEVEVVPDSAVIVGAAGGFIVTVMELVALLPLPSVTL
jgi:hypothetical protein